MSNPATGETTGWDEPLPDFTGVDWAEWQNGETGHAVLRGMARSLGERTSPRWSAAAYYEDAP